MDADKERGTMVDPLDISFIKWNGKNILAVDGTERDLIVYTVSDGTVVIVDLLDGEVLVDGEIVGDWYEFQQQQDHEVRRGLSERQFDAVYLVLCLDGEGR